MSSALEKQIADTLGAAQQTGSEALSFIKERAPILAEQILQYETAVSITGCCLALLILFIFAVVCLITYIKDDDLLPPVACIGGLLSLVTVGPTLTEFLPRLLKVLTAPDLVVLDYIARALGK